MATKKETAKARALSAVYSEQRDNGAKLQKTFLIPHGVLVCSWDENIRDLNEDHVLQWIHTIREGGYVPPVLVEMRGDDPHVIEGFHRWEAYDRILKEDDGFDSVVLCAEWKGDEGDKLVTMRNSAGGLPLSYLEDAEVILQIKKAKNYTPEQLGQHLGISRTAVNNKILLAEAPKAIKKLVLEEKISATAAIEHIIKHGKDALAHIKRALAKAADKGKPRAGGAGPKAFSNAKLRAIAELIAAGADFEQFVNDYDELGDGDVDVTLTLTKADMNELVNAIDDYCDFKDGK